MSFKYTGIVTISSNDLTMDVTLWIVHGTISRDMWRREERSTVTTRTK